jgi:hypothetical protein
MVDSTPRLLDPLNHFLSLADLLAHVFNCALEDEAL